MNSKFVVLTFSSVVLFSPISNGLSLVADPLKEEYLNPQDSKYLCGTKPSEGNDTRVVGLPPAPVVKDSKGRVVGVPAPTPQPVVGLPPAPVVKDSKGRVVGVPAPTPRHIIGLPAPNPQPVVGVPPAPNPQPVVGVPPAPNPQPIVGLPPPFVDLVGGRESDVVGVPPAPDRRPANDTIVGVPPAPTSSLISK